MKNRTKTDIRQDSSDEIEHVSRPCPESSPPPARLWRVGGGEQDGEAGLLYLYSNNCIEHQNLPSDSATNDLTKGLISLLSPYHKKSAHTLYSNVERLISLAPSVGHVGFMTLTFPDNVTDHKEASERFRSFNTNFLSKYPEISHWQNVKERQKRGSWHYHLLVILKEDIRTGFDFEAVTRDDYSSASNYLRTLWRDLREACKKYQFGRSELLPVKSNSEAMGRYIGKYISKHMGQRENRDKGVRLVNSSRGWTKNSVNFAWYNKNSIEWRYKLRLFAEFMGCTELYQLTEKLGKGWAYNYADTIINIKEYIKQNEFLPPHVAPEIKRLVKTQKENLKKLNLVRHPKPSRFPIQPAFVEFEKELPLVDALYVEYLQKQKKKPKKSIGSPSHVPF